MAVWDETNGDIPPPPDWQPETPAAGKPAVWTPKTGIPMPPDVEEHLQKRYGAIASEAKRATEPFDPKPLMGKLEEYRVSHGGQYPDEANPPPEIKSMLDAARGGAGTREDFNTRFKAAVGVDAEDHDWQELQRQKKVWDYARRFAGPHGVSPQAAESVPADMRQEVLSRTQELSQGKPPRISNWNLPGAWLEGSLGTLAKTAEAVAVDPHTRAYMGELRGAAQPDTEKKTWGSLPVRATEMAGTFLNPVAEIAPLEFIAIAHGDTKANLIARGVDDATAEKAALAAGGVTGALFALPGLIKGDPETRTVVGKWISKKLGDKLAGKAAATAGDYAQHLAVGQGLMTGVAVTQADIEEAAQALGGVKNPEYVKAALNAAKESLDSLGPLAILMTPQLARGIATRAKDGKISRADFKDAAQEAGIDPAKLPKTTEEQRSAAVAATQQEPTKPTDQPGQTDQAGGEGQGLNQ